MTFEEHCCRTVFTAIQRLWQITGEGIPRNGKKFYTQTPKISTCPRTHHYFLPKCFLPDPPSSCELLGDNRRNLALHPLPHCCLASHKVLPIGCHGIFSSLPPPTLQWLPNPSLLAPPAAARLSCSQPDSRTLLHFPLSYLATGTKSYLALGSPQP